MNSDSPHQPELKVSRKHIAKAFSNTDKHTNAEKLKLKSIELDFFGVKRQAKVDHPIEV